MSVALENLANLGKQIVHILFSRRQIRSHVSRNPGSNNNNNEKTALSARDAKSFTYEEQQVEGEQQEFHAFHSTLNHSERLMLDNILREKG